MATDVHADAVYRAMLSAPDDDIDALAARLDLSLTEVRLALDALSELALIRPSAERAGRLRPVSPEIGMEILLARQQAAIAAQQHRLETSRLAAAELIADFAQAHPGADSSGAEHVAGLDAIRDRIAQLARGVREQIMTFAPDGSHRAETIEASKPHDRALLERGVRMRTVYLDSSRTCPRTTAYLHWLGDLGGEVRTVPELPTRMIVLDRATAVIPLRSDDSGAAAVVLTGHGTLAALCALFDQVWSGAAPVSQPVARNAAGLTRQAETVVKLLAQGLTDDAIANRLGVSSRTARRLATELMTTLGARSRFEFGVRAVQSGWLPV